MTDKMEDGLRSVLLTQDELDVVAEALQKWADSAKSDGMMAGLVLAVLTHKEGDTLDDSEETIDEVRDAGIEIYKERHKKIYSILAKIL